MSLELARQVDAANPDLLRTNIGSTCHQFTLDLITALRAEGHAAYLMCKSPGEGQYVPPGFQPREVVGLDGKIYTCSGVSHDAIWSDGKQYDTIASANEHAQPIYKKETDPFWSFDPADGPQITGSPVWNAVPPEHWRPNNPPLTDEAATVPPPSTASYPYPDENTAGKAFQDRVHDTYQEAGRDFPDPTDPEAFRHFMRYGYSSHEMPEPEAADKHIKELRQLLNLPV